MTRTHLEAQLDQLINEHSGLYIKVLNPGNQCFDVVAVWCDALGIPDYPGNPTPFPYNHAYQIYTDTGAWHTNYFEKYKNTPEAVPRKGDIIVWGKKYGPSGHVAVVVDADVNRFSAFSQNDPVGSRATVREYKNYIGVEGWLRPRTQEAPKNDTPFYKEEAYDLWYRSLTSDYHRDRGEGMKRYIADFKKAQVERDSLQSALSKALEDIKTLQANNQALLDAQEENYILRSDVERNYIKKEEQEQAFSELTSKHNEIVLNLKNELTACENRLPETQEVLYEYKTPLGRLLGELALIVDGYKR